MGIVPRFEIDENNNKILIMKKKLYQKPNIKVHEVPKDALLAASGSSGQRGWNLKNSEAVTEGNPTVSGTQPGPIINSKRGNLWGDDEE